jgi:hypothetical protein
MRVEQIKPGALVYHLKTGRLYRLGEAHNAVSFNPPDSPRWYPSTEIGRRGEETESHDRSRERLIEDFTLWCEACDGTGSIYIESERCPDCSGEGLIR